LSQRAKGERDVWYVISSSVYERSKQNIESKHLKAPYLESL
jgi:hypothetical protein